ncbi:MAG TPA: ABC transporter ATP-binding protein [Gemmatimonadaceae bacterium]|nr:ABC transporter ATP-binding protein [Gemmatimonadaceae bacterium]
MASIILEQLGKTYPNGYTAVRDLTLEIADGEFLVLVGPSGSGKTTVLRMIAGLEAPTHGSISIGERDVTVLPPQERDVAMVFQSYALYPHMTVRENLSFGLRLRHHPSSVIDQRVHAAAERMGIAPLLDRRPAQLSGGQRQRVALGRAIVREPAAFLFDEPLSNLDARLRVEMRTELAHLHRRLDATMVYVTHDQTEAMTLGDRVAVLHEGHLQQVAPPQELYRNPANQFVAGFIGTPAMNFIDGALQGNGQPRTLCTSTLSIPVRTDHAAVDEDEPVVLGVRPQAVEVDVDGQADGADGAHAVVALVEPLGSEQIVHVALDDDTRIVAVVRPDVPVAEDDRVTVRIPPERVYLFRARDGVRIPVATGPHSHP